MSKPFVQLFFVFCMFKTILLLVFFSGWDINSYPQGRTHVMGVWKYSRLLQEKRKKKTTFGTELIRLLSLHRLTTIQRSDIVQNTELYRAVQHSSQHNLEVSHHCHTIKLFAKQDNNSNKS